MISSKRSGAWRSGLLLAVLALAGVGTLTTVHELTRERIAAEERATLLACDVNTRIRIARVTDQRSEFLELLERHHLLPGTEATVESRDETAQTVRVRRGDGDALDASNLIMPLVFFLSPTDPRMLATLDTINRSPRDGGLVADGLVYRYHVHETDDGLDDLHALFGTLCALAELQQALPGEIRTARPLRLVLDRRPFI